MFVSKVQKNFSCSDILDPNLIFSFLNKIHQTTSKIKLTYRLKRQADGSQDYINKCKIVTIEFTNM